MLKVKYNDEEIEINDELEPGYKEFDLLTPRKKEEKNLPEVKKTNLEDTIKIGDINEQ